LDGKEVKWLIRRLLVVHRTLITQVEAAKIFPEGKKVVVFGVVGAFTSTCTNSHVPSYVTHAAELKKKGVSDIVCIAVNDPFVAKAWQKQAKFDNNITLLVDPDASFTRALNLDVDLSAAGLGVRSKRYSMVVENGVVTAEHVAANPGQVENTGADTILNQMK
jgi:peroxiredoxin